MISDARNYTHLMLLPSCRVFGFANMAAMREGDHNCRGEEHVVELVRSVNSGKIKRVYWNKCAITDFFRQESPETIDFTWKARSGETLRIMRSSTMTEYDLSVDGVCFADLPTPSEIYLATQMEDRSPENCEEVERLRMDNKQDCSVISDLQSELSDDAVYPSSDSWESRRATYCRLAMAGLNKPTHKNKEDHLCCSKNRTASLQIVTTLLHDGESLIQDELHSELYSPVLESLRIQITSCLPQTEELLSRAIMNAFSIDTGSVLSLDSDSLCSPEPLNPYQVEVDCLWDTLEWVRLNVKYAPRPDTEDMAINFFQKHIDAMLHRVRNEELVSDEVARILISVAAALGLKFSLKQKHTTILLDGLSPNVTNDDIYSMFALHGEVEATAISKTTKRFGFCRYVHERSAKVALDNFNSTSIPLLKGSKLTIFLLEEKYDSALQPSSHRISLQAPVCLGTIHESALPSPPADTKPRILRPICSDEGGLHLLSSPIYNAQMESDMR